MRHGTHRNGDSIHRPVMLKEMLSVLEVMDGQRYIDGTMGAGGYSRAILEQGGNVLAIDRDADVVPIAEEIAAEYGERFQFAQGNFATLDELGAAIGFAAVDGVVLDVGVSSMQLDQGDRGFSFRLDGPLDMRMDGEGATAADVVNKAPADDLAAIIRVLGEDRQAKRIAAAIARARTTGPIERTQQLAEVVANATRERNSRIHPATRTFQALRIFINRELENLALALAAAERVLALGGRLVVVAFHSLEDRIVKRFIQSRSGDAGGSRHGPPPTSVPPTFVRPRGQPIKPSVAEIQANPRSRSARLRFAIRGDHPARPMNMGDLGVPPLTGVAGPEAYQ